MVSASSSNGSAAARHSPTRRPADRPKTPRVVGRNDTRKRLRGPVARLARALRSGIRDACGCSRRELSLGEVELEMDVQSERPGQLERSLQEREGCTAVAAPESASAGRGQALRRPLGEGGVGLAELRLVPGRLLEVVAEDLVQLDQALAVLLQPVREPLVQLGAGRLGKRVVSGVADQQVAEAKGIVPGKLRLVGADELLADERGEARRHARPFPDSA